MRFITSEHVIEHLPFAVIPPLFVECYRILQAGGVLRTSTPDLGALAREYVAGSTNAQEMRLRNESVGYHYGPGLVAIINKALYADGHRYVYDLETIDILLQQAGFSQMQQSYVGHSHHESLNNVEHHDVGTIQDVFVLALEATKT